MSCPTPPPLLIPTPHLAQRPVQALLGLFAEALPWLSHRYGLAQVGIKKAENKTYRYPQLYRQDGGLRHDYLTPDAATAALCFFERNGPSTIRWHEGSIQMSGDWQHPLGLVVWCNLERIDNRGYDYADALAADVLRVLVDAGVEVTGVEQRPEQVMGRYTFMAGDQFLLTYPWAAFRIPLVLSEPYNVCAAPFAVLTQSGGCAPDLRA